MSLLPAVWVYFFFLSHLLSPFSSSSSVYPLLYFSLSQSSLLNSVQPPILLHSSLFDSFPGGDGCIGNWSPSYFPLFCKQYIFLLTVTLQTIELTVATLSLSLSLLFLCFLFFFLLISFFIFFVALPADAVGALLYIHCVVMDQGLCLACAVLLLSLTLLSCLSPSVFHLHLTPFFMFYVFMFPLMLPFISHPSFYRLFNPS